MSQSKPQTKPYHQPELTPMTDLDETTLLLQTDLLLCQVALSATEIKAMAAVLQDMVMPHDDTPIRRTLAARCGRVVSPSGPSTQTGRWRQEHDG